LSFLFKEVTYVEGGFFAAPRKYVVEIVAADGGDAEFYVLLVLAADGELDAVFAVLGFGAPVGAVRIS
jgi:hypothetical protein